MRIILLLLLSVSLCKVFAYSAEYETTINRPAMRYARQVESRIERGEMNAVVNEAITEIIRRSSVELNRRGNYALAEEIYGEWNYDYKNILLERNIGDHLTEMLSMWLYTAYRKVEHALGKDFCVSSHISDLLPL